VVQAADGAVLRDAAEAAPGEDLRIRLARGRLRVTVGPAPPPTLTG
ncbi:MAG: exodeoxyribonuclease VII large subunit, partial [Geodermatophilaceae bacterium]|nr:exodeoxyribonuclease VII large subunit [Geodermatophilaceae bacterium]